MRYILKIICVFFLFQGINAQNDALTIFELPSVNTQYDDYAPIFIDSVKMIFTSSMGNPEAEHIMEDSHNLYSSEKHGESWAFPKFVSYLSNSDNYETSAGVSDDRNTLYIYKAYNGGDIYSISIKGNNWSTPKRAHFNTPYHECHAFKLKKSIFFISDMPGGKGKHDIWLILQDDYGYWSKPINMEVLNSEEDEHHIFLTEDGKTLYFSSKGHNSLGGYDIFKSVLKNDNIWSEPENMGSIVNTEYNDICFTFDLNGKIYFASDRPSDNAGYNIFSGKEEKIRKKVPVVMTGISPIVETNTGKVNLIKDSVLVECYEKYIPDKIEVNTTEITDSTKILYINDLIVDSNVEIIENKEEAIIEIKMIYKKLENLTLEEVKKEIDFEIRFCKVQVGAFAYMKSIIDFAIKFPLLGDKVMMIRNEKYIRFLMRETFESIDSAAVLQKKCLYEYNSVPDTFIAVYDMSGKRVLIYFDIEKENYILLRPENQYIDDIL